MAAALLAGCLSALRFRLRLLRSVLLVAYLRFMARARQCGGGVRHIAKAFLLQNGRHFAEFIAVGDNAVALINTAPCAVQRGPLRSRCGWPVCYFSGPAPEFIAAVYISLLASGVRLSAVTNLSSNVLETSPISLWVL